MTNRRLTVRRITVGGTEVQHWLDGNVIVIEFGEKLDEVTRKRVERDIRERYGLRKRRAIPLLGLPAGSWQAKHPLVIPATAGVAVSAVVVAAVASAFHPDKPTAPPAAQGPGPAPTTATEPHRPGTRPRTRQPEPPVAAAPAPSQAPPPATTARRQLPYISASMPLSAPELKLPRKPPIPAIPTEPVTPNPTEPAPIPVPPTDAQLTVQAGDAAALRVQWHKPTRAKDPAGLRLQLQLGKARPVTDAATRG